jgi:uncharacterized protein
MDIPPTTKMLRHTDGSITTIRRVSFGRLHRFPQKYGLDTIIETPGSPHIAFEIERTELPDAEMQGAVLRYVEPHAVDKKGRRYLLRGGSTPFTGPPPSIQRTYWIVNNTPPIGVSLIVRVYLATLAGRKKHSDFLFNYVIENTNEWRSRVHRLAVDYWNSPERRSDDLVRAMYKDDKKRVLALVQEGVRVTTSDKTGYTDLIWALHKKDKALSKLLLLKARRVGHIRGIDGRTPLMWAAEGGMAEIVSILIEQKVDLRARDTYGRSALDLAKEQKQVQTIQLLQKALQ